MVWCGVVAWRRWCVRGLCKDRHFGGHRGKIAGGRAVGEGELHGVLVERFGADELMIVTICHDQ